MAFVLIYVAHEKQQPSFLPCILFHGTIVPKIVLPLAAYKGGAA